MLGYSPMIDMTKAVPTAEEEKDPQVKSLLEKREYWSKIELACLPAVIVLFAGLMIFKQAIFLALLILALAVVFIPMFLSGWRDTDLKILLEKMRKEQKG